jgi:tetratricopeptide (TPR) repeat protein
MNLIIKSILVLVLVSSVLLNAFGQETKDDKYKIAVDKYSNGNYPEALKIWTEIYNTGYRSAELAYNIGNGYFKLNDVPGAILFYERANLLNPADEDINYNLQIARSLVTDKFEEIPELFFIKWFNFISLLLRTNSWALISLITFILFLLLISLYIYSSRYRFKVLGFWFALFFLTISVSSLSFSIRNKNLVYNSKKAVIFNPLVSGKSSPDNSGTDLFVLHEGTKVSVEDEVGEWLEIRLSDGNKGWVPADCLEII